MSRTKAETPSFPQFGDHVSYHDPESGRTEKAVVVDVHEDGSVALMFRDGRHTVTAYHAVPKPGQFGGFQPVEPGA